MPVSLDDATIDRMLREAERKPLHIGQIVRAGAAGSSIAYGTGTTGLGTYAESVAHLQKDRAMFQHLANSETKRLERMQREAEERSVHVSSSVQAADERRAARQAAEERRQQQLEQARQLNSQRHAEALQAERDRVQAETAMLQSLKQTRKAAAEAAQLRRQELTDERAHERSERERREQELAERTAEEKIEDQRRAQRKTAALRERAQQAHEDARMAVRDLRNHQRERAIADRAAVRQQLAARAEVAAKEREANREWIIQERALHNAKLDTAAASRSERLTMDRDLAKTPAPAAGAIAEVRAGRVAAVRESIQRNRELQRQTPTPVPGSVRRVAAAKGTPGKGRRLNMDP